MKKILLIKTTSLGDVIHNLPVVNDILQHLGEAHIDWVVEQSFAEIPRLHPQVRHVIPVAMRRWRKAWWHKSTWHEIRGAKAAIGLERYDCVIDTQGLLKSACLTRWAEGEKHGYDRNSIREPLASWFYDLKHAISYDQHAVKRNRALTAMSLGYPPPIDVPDYGISGIFLKGNASETRMDIGLQANYIVALHGTSRDSKLWPAEHWVTLGNALHTKKNQLVLPWGNATEYARAQAIAAQVPQSVVLPKLGITKLADVIAGAQAAVGVDTGLTHFAVALAKPTVAIYTDTEPSRTGVLASKHAAAMNLGGVSQIPSPEEVLEGLKKIIQKS